MQGDIKRSRFNDYLLRLLGMETNPPAPTLAGEIQPIIEVEPYNLESYWLSGHKLCGSFVSGSAGVATVTQARLRNPAGSGIVAIVEKLIVSSSGNDNFDLSVGATTSDYGTINTRGFRDGRIGGLPTCIMSQTLGAGIAPQIGRVHLLAFNPVTIYEVAVLPPGASLEFNWASNSVAQLGLIHWRERALPAVEIFT